MAFVLDGVGFSQRAHYECTEQALEVVLRYHGYELDEILYDDWAFGYAADGEGRPLGLEPGPPIDRARKFHEYGIGLSFRTAESADEAWERIRARVAAGHPVPVWIDPFYLRYYSPHLRRHTDHAVVVTGYDDVERTAHIVDPSPWQLFSDSIPLHDLKAALDSDHHRKTQEANSWAEFDLPSQPVGRRIAELQDLLARNVQGMVAGGQQSITLEDGRAGTAATGVHGIRSLAEDLSAWSQWPSEELSRYMAGSRDPLQAVGRRRYGHACFLACAARRMGNAALASVAPHVQKLADAWFLPANMMFKGSLREPMAMLSRVQRRLCDLADLEENLVSQMGLALAGACCYSVPEPSPGLAP